MKKFIAVSLSILILFVLLSQCTSSQKIVGHPFEVRGEYYDSNPAVPLITQEDINVAASASAGTIHDFAGFNDLYNQYSYRCFSLKNEGPTAFTTAQSAAAGTSRTEQMLNFYSIAKDTVQREENCQQSITVIERHQFSSSQMRPSSQLYSELNTNMQITTSDENKEITNYNTIAADFNNAILRCPTSDQVIGTDGMCHDISVAPNIYSA